MNNKIRIPEKYYDQLVQLLTQMESETKNKYKITISQFGHYSNEDLVIGDFNNRQQTISVVNMKPKYKELEGLYSSIEKLEAEIARLRTDEIFEETKLTEDGKLIGKCKHCHSYNENVLNRVPNFIDNDHCQNDTCPHSRFQSIWNGMKVDNTLGMIYKSGGGSISIMRPKGSWVYN